MTDRALLHLLGDVREVLLNDGYGDRIWNGGRCSTCCESGCGSSEPHKHGCKGVVALRDINRLLDKPQPREEPGRPIEASEKRGDG